MSRQATSHTVTVDLPTQSNTIPSRLAIASGVLLVVNLPRLAVLHVYAGNRSLFNEGFRHSSKLHVRMIALSGLFCKFVPSLRDFTDATDTIERHEFVHCHLARVCFIHNVRPLLARNRVDRLVLA